MGRDEQVLGEYSRTWARSVCGMQHAACDVDWPHRDVAKQEPRRWACLPPRWRRDSRKLQHGKCGLREGRERGTETETGTEKERERDEEKEKERGSGFRDAREWPHARGSGLLSPETGRRVLGR